MPTPKLKASERRRCTKACDRCKRRKEGCDGLRPCRRCTARGVGRDCTFAQSPPPPISPVTASGQEFSSDSHNPHEHDPGNPLPCPASPGPLSIETLHHARRPRKCSPFSRVFRSSRAAPVPQLSRLTQDSHGTFMFIGNAANLSFHKVIRNIVRDSLGRSPHADEPTGDDTLRHLRVEATSPSRSTADWVMDMAYRPPRRPDSAEIEYLALWYLRATNCVGYLFDGPELRQKLSHWLQADLDGQQQDAGTSAVFFLVFAIGAQVCPENRDAIAEQYFNYGRFLTMSHIMEEPTISTVQANVLITTYLLGASRPDAASMYLGTAVRAAYALGIDQIDINRSVDSSEYILRERLWRALRILDLFLSTSLGRSPCTQETRDTGADTSYSASNDLCYIFEAILAQVYSKPAVSTDVLDRISQYHRQWAARYSKGLALDAILPGEVVAVGGGKTAPNFGFIHLIQAYYWTTMLITRPSLIESVSRHIYEATGHTGSNEVPASAPLSVQALAHACVHSAVRTVELLRGLMSAEGVPKRLPFVVNCSFVAALVLGLAQFGDLDRAFSLGENLDAARSLLLRFSRHDAVARRNVAIVQDLQAACDLYLNRRERRKMEREALLFSGMFGTVNGTYEFQMPLHGRTPVEGLRQASWQPALSPASIADKAQPSSSDSSNFSISIGPETQAWTGLGTELSDMVPGLGALSDLILPMSPSALMFDSFDNLPTFPATDARIFSFEEGSIDDSIEANTQC
ncbi:hypothetical protein ACJZ2D_013098 [Fusarium nematophilum]